MNLVVAVCGDQSLHRVWFQEGAKFDLFVVYYGKEPDKFRGDGTYYATARGSKFQIIHQILDRYPQTISQYHSIFIPDDDVYLETAEINKFFDIFKNYELHVAQPAILGYISWPLTTPQHFSLLRYTNLVEIMCPCFSYTALSRCKKSFMENKTNWGIELLWHNEMGNPKDKFAIVDEVVAIHTRPCFFGDTYYNNGTSYEIAKQEGAILREKYNIDSNRQLIYSTIESDVNEFHRRPSEEKVMPQSAFMKEFLLSLREKLVVSVS